MLYYSITYHEDGWLHSFVTSDYTRFFDEAVKVLDAKAPDITGPAFTTNLPAFEDGKVDFMGLGVKDVGIIEFKTWVSNYEAATNL